MTPIPAPSTRQRILARAYVADAAEVEGVTTDAVLGRTKSRKAARARRAAMIRLHDDGVRQATIAVLFGRDRSTVSVSLRGGKGRWT